MSAYTVSQLAHNAGVSVHIVRDYCSGQEKLATVLCSNQNNRSDSFGVRPPL